MNTRDLIIICLTAIILILLGMFILFNSSGGETTILTMENSPTLTEGDSLTLKLNDDNGSAISGQRIQINLTHEDNGITENFTLKTGSNGQCRLEDLPAGNFSLIGKYNGNKHYKASTISGELTVKKKPSSSINQKSNSSNFKSDYNVDDVINGWDPSEHEVSREDLGEGNQRIEYDDGYFRIVDKEGNILNYGY